MNTINLKFDAELLRKLHQLFKGERWSDGINRPFDIFDIHDKHLLTIHTAEPAVNTAVAAFLEAVIAHFRENEEYEKQTRAYVRMCNALAEKHERDGEPTMAHRRRLLAFDAILPNQTSEQKRKAERLVALGWFFDMRDGPDRYAAVNPNRTYTALGNDFEQLLTVAARRQWS